MQDIVSSTDLFPVGSFTKLCLVPWGDDPTVSNVDRENYLTWGLNLTREEQSYFLNPPCDYMLMITSKEKFPLHINITEVNRVIFEVSGHQMTFSARKFVFHNQNDGAQLIVALDYAQRTDCEGFRNFVHYIFYPQKGYRNARVAVKFKYKNLFFKQRRGKRVSLVMMLHHLNVEKYPPVLRYSAVILDRALKNNWKEGRVYD